MAANPAVNAFVVLSMPPALRDEHLEKAFSWVFRVWPFAMLIAPALGRWIANLWGIRVDLWIGGAAYLLAMVVSSFTVEVRSESLGFLATSAAAGIAGLLYGLTRAHTLPLLISSIGIPLVFVSWLIIVRPLTGEPHHIARRECKGLIQKPSVS